MYNVFEDVPDRRHNEIAAIKGQMLDAGALGSVMTGTGSAVFGIFADPADAEKCAKALRRDYRCVSIAHNVPRLEV